MSALPGGGGRSLLREAAGPLALLAAGWALTLWVAPWSDERVNDLFVYRSFAEPVLAGALPYRDILFEYPPLAAPVIALPGLAGTGEEAFRAAFAIWTLAGAAALVLLSGALARAAGADPRRALWAAALMPLLLGALVRTHFDVFPVALVVGALLLLARERPRAGLALLGVGAMTKAFPLVVAVVALAWLVAAGRRRAAWQGALACVAVMAVAGGVAAALSPDGALDAVRYHLERPVQVESSPALVLLGLEALGAGEAESVQSHRSDGLLHPAADALAWAFALALAASLAWLALAAAGAARSGPNEGAGGRPAGLRALVLAGLAAPVAFALLGKVLSPQFAIWAVPLGALALAWRLHALAAAVGLAALLTQVEFPARYFDVVAGEPLAVTLVALRNLALLAALALTARALQPRRREQLLDRGRPALAVDVD